MHPLIRFAAFLVFLSLAALSVLAGTNSSRPVLTRVFQPRQIYRLDHLLRDSVSVLTPKKKPASETEGSSAGAERICSCQILNLGSSNYDHRYVVLLAEKTKGTGFKEARNRIQKEKKNLKKLFYDKVKLVAEMQGQGTCKSLYFRLHAADSKLQLYEILNAD
jgi:hypothetical protein